MTSTITRQNLKIYKSDNTADVPDGGGRVTTVEVVDGQSNDLFADIPQVSRAYGDVDVIKIFPALNTQNDEPLLGSFFTIGDLPEDPNVNITLFTTKDWFDRRYDAVNSLEGYLSPAPLISGQLLEKQLKGQKAIQVFMEVSAEPPAIGKSLYLVENEDANNEFSQYVRVMAITTQLRDFRVNGKNVTKKVATLEISTKLEHTFTGNTVKDYEDGIPPKANVRDTRVADTAEYYTTKKLEKDVSAGSSVVKIDGAFTQLVPSAQIETPLSGLNAIGKSTTLVPTKNGLKRVIPSYQPNASVAAFLGAAVTPLSVKISTGSGVITDEGGDLKLNGTSVGNIDYQTGEIVWLASFNIERSTFTFEFVPAATPVVTTDTFVHQVTEANRGFSWVRTLFPLPMPSTLQVSYIAQGNIYVLTDNGNGELVGASSDYGTGTVNYETGDVVLTLGAEPDIDSYVFYAWGSSKGVVDLTDGTRQDNLLFTTTLPEPATAGHMIQPKDIEITWANNGTKRATCSSSGVITGEATGRYDSETRQLYIAPKVLPPKGTQFTVAYKQGLTVQSGLGSAAIYLDVVETGAGDTLKRLVTGSLNKATADIVKGSVSIACLVQYCKPFYSYYYSNLNSTKGYAPNIRYKAETTLYLEDEPDAGDMGKLFVNDKAGGIGRLEIGTLNYATGVYIFDIALLKTLVRKSVYTTVGNGYNWGHTAESVQAAPLIDYDWDTNRNGKNVKVYTSFQGTDNLAIPKSQQVTVDEYTADFGGMGNVSLIEASFTATLFGQPVFVRAGNVVTLNNIAKNSTDTTVLGSIDKFQQKLKVTNWTVGASNQFKLISAMAEVNDLLTDKVVFRIPILPVKPDTLQILGEDENGDNLNIVFDKQGKVNHPEYRGSVNYQTGLVRLEFWEKIRYYENVQSVPETEKETYINYILGKAKQLTRKIWFSYGSHSEYTEEYTVYAGREPWYRDSLKFEENGLLYIAKPKKAKIASIRYNAVSYTYIPLDKDILGIDTVKLPASGQVPAFRDGNLMVIQAKKRTELTDLTPNKPIDLGKSRLSLIEIVDSLGVKLPYNAYTVDLDAGKVTLKTGFPTTGYQTPYVVNYSYQDLATASDVLIDGTINLTKVLTHDFSAADTTVSSALLMGNLQARVYNIFTQGNWNNRFLDHREGSDSLYKYDTAAAPILVTNDSSYEEDWALIFTTNTAFKLVGKNVGEVGTGTINEDFTPLNPTTNRPLMVIKKEGHATNAVAGNVLRFKTKAANYPVWLVRTVLQSNATELNHKFSLEFKGDKDRTI